jgi:hypothetical protein
MLVVKTLVSTCLDYVMITFLFFGMLGMCRDQCQSYLSDLSHLIKMSIISTPVQICSGITAMIPKSRDGAHGVDLFVILMPELK